MTRTVHGQTKGSATVLGKSAPRLRSDGQCLTGTLRSLGSGADPMSPSSLEKIKADALALMGKVVAVYADNIADGEVGVDGSACASESEPTEPCTGLLYGRIQSGKTVAMIALVAAAIDNGFRVVVVLTSDNTKLVAQTAERFADLEGPITLDATVRDAWSTDHKHISKYLAQSGVVFVCSKNQKRLDDLILFLKEEIGASKYPALILDDEADQATLDTNLARNSRAKSKGKAPVDPTAIYNLVVQNLRKSLRHHVFLQVTATPYALLLQSVGAPLRPSFTHLLEPGVGYTGGEKFFEAAHIEGPQPPLVYVGDAESQTILGGASEAPEGLKNAIAFFIIASGAQAILDPDSVKSGQNFLCHTSQLRQQHRNLETLVRTYVDRVGDSVDTETGEAFQRLHMAHVELRRTLPNAPAFESVLEQIRRRLVGRRVVVVNAGADAEPGRALNFIVGGNILGRGVTIKNLLVTYYLREPKIGQMDTMLQHARMYGYREKLMPFTRVYLPEQLAVRFHEIHCIERRLRKQLIAADMGKQIVIEKASNLKTTRGTVLDPSYIDVFDAEDQVFPKHPDLAMARAEYERIHARVQKLVGGQLSTSAQLEAIDYDELLKLVDEFPYNSKFESSSWIPGVLRRVLEKQRERCEGRAYLYTRKTNRKTRTFATGVLSGKELAELRDMDGPVLCAFRDDGKLIPAPPANEFWHPTLVLDKGMPSLVVNVTPDEP
jgi:hypothetical protein